jgi:hypothetical protein
MASFCQRRDKGTCSDVDRRKLAKLFRLLLLDKTRTGAYCKHIVSFIASGFFLLALESSFMKLTSFRTDSDIFLLSEVLNPVAVATIRKHIFRPFSALYDI